VSRSESSDRRPAGHHHLAYVDTALVSSLLRLDDRDVEECEFLGEEVTILVGIGKKEVYLAAGNDPLKLLKSAMDKSKNPGDEYSPLQYNFYLTPILKFFADIEGEETMEEMADTLAANGKDRISVTASYFENGMKMRFEMEDGILELAKVAAESIGRGFGGGGDDF